MPRPRSLTHADIVGAALAVLDRDGLAKLSMRAVAAELGTSAMALYRYVADRGQLEERIVEHLLSAVDLTLPAGASWKEQVAALMERVRAVIAAHPAAVTLLLTHRHRSPASLRWIDTMLRVLVDAGLTGTERAIAQRSLVGYLLGSLHTQHLGPLSGPGTKAMAALPVGEYPHLTETAEQARHITPDEEFRRGLAIFLRGLETTPSS
ncbi:MAG TPA: TetR/AcrR family transcriptional regulator C-terminal domain-containing protein [Amycolatopsis sp.]|jgi:AcrR family transcriptional regulator|nr:TetR/AcrR family transcriptional regulator C-terminal domain-containing protein [Amycolatopsis sp.]